MKSTRLIIPLIFLAFAACGPRAKISADLERTKLNLVALLPPAASDSVRSERVQVIRKALSSSLRNHGFYLLDDEIVTQVCGTAASCDRSQELHNRYNVDAYLEASIKSASTNNFLAGYVDVIQGKLRLLSPDKTELVSVDHSETDTGGLLFESGQVIQGLKSEIGNFGDESFNVLASKFSERIVSKIPLPKNQAEVGDSVNLAAVETRTVRPLVYEVCASGNPNGAASIIVGKIRSNLREGSPGRYCGIYRIENLAQASVELRSPYGNVARREVNLAADSLVCDLKGAVRLKRKGSSNELQLASECPAAKVLVFRSAERKGPYQQVGELRAGAWIDRKPAAESFYQVIAVSKTGAQSLPSEPTLSEM